MDRNTYKLVENYMLSCMKDSAHDKEHIYRVLYVALDIAKYEDDVDTDVLICVCLLHDIGRQEQFDNPEVCHAAVGAHKAQRFLREQAFGEAFVETVGTCIQTHRFRSGVVQQSIEAKILFDADKIDVTGAIGIARTIFYQGQVSEPLYSVSQDGQVSDGAHDTEPSFFREYKYKLERLYSTFYTKRGAEIAAQRQTSAVAFYSSMLEEVRSSYSAGSAMLDRIIG